MSDLTEITCQCIVCENVQVFTDDDPIDDDGPVCGKCCGPMVPTKIRTMRKTERDALAEVRPRQ